MKKFLRFPLYSKDKQKKTQAFQAKSRVAAHPFFQGQTTNSAARLFHRYSLFFILYPLSLAKAESGRAPLLLL